MEEVTLYRSDGRDGMRQRWHEQEEGWLRQREVCSVQRKLLPPCAGFPAAAVPSSGEVGVRAPSARGPK